MSGQSLITTKEIATGIKTADDINKPDFSVGVTDGTTSEISARGMMPKARIVVKKTLAEVLDLMLQGKVMGVITDYPTASVVALQYRDKGIISLKPFTVEPVGIAIRPDDFLFVNLMQNFLNMLQINGQLQAMTNRWFENPWWLNQLPAMYQFL
jgi:polar amino acid transport system substrate-binding protein